MKNLHTDLKENGPVKNSPTPEDLRQMQQRRIEQHENQQAADTLNLARAAKLGRALKRQEG